MRIIKMQNLLLFVYQLKTKLRTRLKKKLQNKIKENDNKTFDIADLS